MPNCILRDRFIVSQYANKIKTANAKGPWHYMFVRYNMLGFRISQSEPPNDRHNVVVGMLPLEMLWCCSFG